MVLHVVSHQPAPSHHNLTTELAAAVLQRPRPNPGAVDGQPVSSQLGLLGEGFGANLADVSCKVGAAELAVLKFLGESLKLVGAEGTGEPRVGGVDGGDVVVERGGGAVHLAALITLVRELNNHPIQHCTLYTTLNNEDIYFLLISKCHQFATSTVVCCI